MTTATHGQPTEVAQMIEQLYRILADTYVLYAKTQNFHWNITDARFYSLHIFLEKQYQELAEANDLIAEHIRTFNVPAPGNLKQFLELTSLQEAEDVTDGDVMLLELYRDNQALANTLRQAIAFADDHNDAASSDLLVERLRAHDKAAWMLRSHLPRGNSAL